MYKHSFLLFLTLLFLSLVGSASETLAQKIQVRGDIGFAPFEYLDETGTPAGFDVDILQAVAEVMNLDVELSLGKWENVRSELEQGQIDALIGMRYSEERAATVDFSTPYLINTSAIFVRSDSSIQSLEDLRGKKVIIQRGDIMDDYIQDINLTASIVFVGNQTEALKLLASGEHDAALCSRLRGLFLVSQMKLDNITVVGRKLAAGPYGFAVAKGNSDLLTQINEGLRILKATGRYDEIYQRWFGLYEKKTFYWDLFRYAVWVLGPLLLLLGAATIWSWTLKNQVALKTRELSYQFEKRQHAEARLESEKRFRQLIEASPVPIVTIGSDQRLLYVNNKFSELFGYTLEELTDTASWWALACPDPNQRQAVLSAWQDCFDGRDPASLASEPFEVDVTCQNGSICHVVCRHATIEGLHVLVFNDITKRKLVETALEERGRIEAMVSDISTRFINLSFDKLGPEIDRALQQIGQQVGFDRCYVFELDADGLTMSNTHEWCAKGIESQLPRLQEVPWDDFSWYLQELSEKGFFYCPSVASLGPEAQVEREEWLREGIKSLITVPMLLKGEMVGFIGLDSVKRERSCPEEILFLLRIVGECFANALERRRVDHKLHSAHQRLQDIIDFLPDATFVVDKGGTVMAWNRAMEKMTGVSKEQMLGQGNYAYSEALYGERRPTLIDLVQNPDFGHNMDFNEGDENAHALFDELYLPRLYGGKGAYVSAKASPLCDRKGTFSGAIESIRDISDRKEAEEKLEASNRELEAFVYTVSHDLRTPLTPIIGYADFLSETYRDQLDDQAISCLVEISTAGNKMHKLMEDLLELAKVGQLGMPQEPVDAGAVVEEVLEALAQQIVQAEVQVTVTTLPLIRVPRTLLYQIFSNLISNAIHYAGKQGSPIEVGGECHANSLSLYVRDHGPGIPSTERERIFEAFYRGSSARDSAGSGVGLATVQKIARLYGGKARVEETPGGGATFLLEMQEDSICTEQSIGGAAGQAAGSDQTNSL